MKSILVALAVALSCGVAPAQGVPGIVATVESAAIGFATPQAVAGSALTLEFANLDSLVHNVVSSARGPDSNPWCAKYRYARGECPLFRSDDLANNKSGEVFGVRDLPSGQSYVFVCTYHAGTMRGTLTILPV